jgi:hypothetical protein
MDGKEQGGLIAEEYKEMSFYFSSSSFWLLLLLLVMKLYNVYIQSAGCGGRNSSRQQSRVGET